MSLNILLEDCEKKALKLLNEKGIDIEAFFSRSDYNDINSKLKKIKENCFSLNKLTNVYVYSACKTPRFLINTNENIKITRKKEKADIIVVPDELKSRCKYIPWEVHLKNYKSGQIFFYSMSPADYVHVELIKDVDYGYFPKFKYIFNDLLATTDYKKYITETTFNKVISKSKREDSSNIDEIFELLKSNDFNTKQLGLNLLAQSNIIDNRIKIYNFFKHYRSYVRDLESTKQMIFIKKILDIRKLDETYYSVINKYISKYNELSVSDKKLFLDAYLDDLKYTVKSMRSLIKDLPFELTMNLKINDPDLK